MPNRLVRALSVSPGSKGPRFNMATASSPLAASSLLSLTFLDALTAIVGTENVLRDRAELLVYECDGYVINRNVPDVVVFPTYDRAGGRDRQALQPARCPIRAARGRDEPGGGNAGAGRRGDDLPDPDEADHRDQHPRPLRDRRAGGRQPLAHAGPGGNRVSLRTRPVEPVGLHDRRQRGDELGRAAHAQIRRDGQPRARRRAGPARRIGRRHRRRDRGQSRL